MKTRIAILTCALAALAAAPAAASQDPIAPHGPPSPEFQPPDMCFETVQFAFCTSDLGPLTQRALADPAGTTVWVAGVAVHIVCSDPRISCSITS